MTKLKGGRGGQGVKMDFRDLLFVDVKNLLPSGS